MPTLSTRETQEFGLARDLADGIKCFMASSKGEREAKDAVPGRISFLDGQGEMPMLEISTRWSTAEIYLHGAHVTRFNKKDEAPLLFRPLAQPHVSPSAASSASGEDDWQVRVPAALSRAASR